MSGRGIMFALVGIVLGICAACLWPTDADKLDTPGISIDPQAMLDPTGLAAAGDNFTWQNHPNLNQGTATELRTGITSTARAFFRWTQATIDSIVGTGTLVSARLDVTINSSSGWSGSGGQLSIHRVTKNWTELGSTANCAIDTNTGNDLADCSGATAWVLNNPSVAPWKSAPTDSLGVSNGQTGKISFNVTADVQKFLDDTANFGWVIKPRNDASNADIRLRSREATSNQPVLVIIVDADTSPPPIPEGFVAPDSSQALLATPPDEDSVLVLRNFVNIGFHDSTSGQTIQFVLGRYNAQVTGGFPRLRTYIVQVPDPGTYASLESLMAVIRTEPGVRFVARFVFREPLRDPGRYPSDDPQTMRRQDWLGPPSGATDGTRALRVIQAREAWGCENGLYGADTIAVGVMDNVFDPTVSDLLPSFKQTHPLSPSEPLGTPISGSQMLSHGNGVAGVLTARGNNNTGVAGLVWQSELHLFRLAGEDGGATKEALQRGLVIADVIRLAATTPVRILVSSIEAQPDSNIARVIAEEISDFVNASPGRVFVQAGQNYRVTIRPDTIFKVKAPGFLMHQAMAILDAMPAKSRVLFVASANKDGTDIRGFGGGPNDPGTTLVTGVTDVLAPGEDILVLARPVDFPAGTMKVSGASFAAPMVAGVAAQLWDFYPSLTADEIKTYVMKGAEERIDASGVIVNVGTVPNSGGLHLLNAYQSLARVAREKNDSPVCGFPVYVREGSVLFERVPGTTQAMSFVGGPADASALSVAQGGRRLAADLFFPGSGTTGVFEFDHQGVILIGPLPNVSERHFLERDTVNVRRSGDSVYVTRIGPSGTVAFELTTQIPPAFESSEVSFSPDGAWVAATLEHIYPTGPFTAEDTVGLYVLPFVNNPTETQIAKLVPFPPGCTTCQTFSMNGIGWSNDSRRAMFTAGLVSTSAPFFTTQIWDVSVGPSGINTQTPPPISGVDLRAPRFNPNDSTLVSDERNPTTGVCAPALRLASNFSLLTGGAPRTLCADFRPPGIFFGPPPVAGFQFLPPALRSVLDRRVGPRPPLRRVTPRQ